MTAPDELSYERAAERIVRIMAALATLGAVVACAVWDWKSGAGFLLGSLISGLNFILLKGLVNRLGGARPRRRFVLAYRYLLLAGSAYVILRVSPISLPAVLAGIFVFTVAVFIEVIFEIAYARK
jgi:F0F1-type ATP synthase assembly protein I